MPRGIKPWKEKMNRGNLTWEQQQEEEKKQKTLDNWDEEEEDETND